MRAAQRHKGYFLSLGLFLFVVISIFPSPLFASEPILLSITLNKEQKGIFIGEMAEDGRILLLESDLRQMGISDIEASHEEINGEAYIYIGSINGAKVVFDEENLALEITVPPGILNGNVIDLYPQRRQDVYYPNDSSAFLNYRVEYFDGTSLEQSLTLANELGVRFGSFLFLTDNVYTNTPSENSLIRLMTALNHDDRQTMMRIVAGDFLTSSGELGSVANMGGLSFSKLFSIDPYFIKSPLLDISGVTALPSEVSIYRDGTSMFSRRVSPGEFEIENISYYDGASDVELVITDIFGREHRISSPYYFTSRLLRKGIQEYSYNLGALRENFGLESNDYGNLVFSGFHRYGFNNFFTGGLRTEVTKGLWNVGSESAVRLWEAGVLELGMAESGGERNRSGFGGFARYQYRNKRFTGNIYTRWHSRDYTTINTINSIQRSKFNGRVDVGYSAYNIGSFGISYTVITRYDDYERRVAGFSYSKSLTRNSRFFISLSNIAGTEQGNEIFFGFSYYPWKDHSVSSSVQLDKDRDIEAVSVQKAIPIGEGYGYGALFQRAHFTGGTSYDINPYVQYNSPYGTLTGNLTIDKSDAGTKETCRLAVAGGLALIDKTFGVMRPVHDSFALVKVGDLEGVSVLKNNQKIGETNEEGKIFVPDLTSFFENQVSIKDSEIPIDYYMPEVLHVISPPFRSGSCIFFDLEKVHALSGTVKREVGGTLVPVSSSKISMMIDEQDVTFFTGSAGEFYFDRSAAMRKGEYPREENMGCTLFGEEEPFRSKVIRAGTYTVKAMIGGTKHTCTFTVPDGDEMVTEIGDILCREVKTSDAGSL